jgi:hypothetical protein
MKKRHLDVGISFNFFKSHQSSQPRYFAQKINVWFTSSNQRNFAKFSPSFAHYAAIARWRPRRCPTTTASKKMMQELLHLIGARRWEFLRTESILISDPSAMMEAIFNCALAPGPQTWFYGPCGGSSLACAPGPRSRWRVRVQLDSTEPRRDEPKTPRSRSAGQSLILRLLSEGRTKQKLR